MARAFASTLATSDAQATAVTPKSRNATCGIDLHDIMKRSYHRAVRPGVTSRPNSEIGAFMRSLLRYVAHALGVSLLLCASAHADELDTVKKKGELICGVLGT